MRYSLSNNNHVIIWIFNFLFRFFFRIALGWFFKLKNFRAISANERQLSIFPIGINSLLVFRIIKRVKSNHPPFTLSTSVFLPNKYTVSSLNLGPIIQKRCLFLWHELNKISKYKKIKNKQKLYILLVIVMVKDYHLWTIQRYMIWMEILLKDIFLSIECKVKWEDLMNRVFQNLNLISVYSIT